MNILLSPLDMFSDVRYSAKPDGNILPVPLTWDVVRAGMENTQCGETKAMTSQGCDLNRGSLKKGCLTCGMMAWSFLLIMVANVLNAGVRIPTAEKMMQKCGPTLSSKQLMCVVKLVDKSSQFCRAITNSFVEENWKELLLIHR